MAGPKTETILDFWMLVWQERPPTIVMLTNLMEADLMKCSKYWPELNLVVGPLIITLTEIEYFADYCIRTFIIRVSGPLFTL